MKIAAPRFPHVVIRASAGTGKTFQLSNRFLELVASGEPPDQILATTFARKAAGEILDRVLLRLAEASDDPKAVVELAKHVQPKSADVRGETAALDRPRCGRLLRSLVDHLHRLQISTLDSFFAQIAGSFSLELGLPLGWRIVEELEDDQIRAEAIQQMLEDAPAGESTTLVCLLRQGDAVRSITGEITDVVSALYDVFRQTEPTPDVWRQLPHRKELDPSELNDALANLAAVPLEGKSLGNARNGDLEKAASGNWGAFIAAGLARPLLAGEEKYSRQLIPTDIVAAYQPLLKHAGAVLVNRLANQNEGTYQLLAHFDAAYRPLKQSRRAARFDDVTRYLAAGFSDGRLEDVAYRLDARVLHLLLDEFQDTSLPQWEVLSPFARQVTAPGSKGSLFCVGDAKQAIYGWRGGLAELLNALGGELPALTNRDLTTSYRSSPVVIDVVNRVFTGLSSNAALTDFASVTAAWAERFTPHSTARTELTGCCRLLTAPKADGQIRWRAQQEATLEYAASVVAAAARDNPGRTIGVLVRRNKAIGRLIHWLRQKHNLFASQEGGNPLTDSLAVQLILSLLALADHPGNRVARFHVARSPLGPALEFLNHDDDSAAWRLASAVRGTLLADGYGPTIYGWVKRLAATCDARDLSRLEQLVELAYGFDDGAIRRPDEFIAQVEQKKVEDPLSAPIRVMTIHKAKGLEFDIVVLPQLDEPLIGQPPKLVEGRETPTGPIQRVCRYANEALQALLPAEFQRMFAERNERVTSESLSTLYVAMTRAVHQLDMIVAPQKIARRDSANGKRSAPTYAQLLLGALCEGDEAAPQTELYRHGESAWSTAAAPASPHAILPSPVRGEGPGVRGSDGAEIHVELGRSAGPRRRGLDRRSPSKLEGGAKIDLRQLLRLDSSAALVRGTLFHKWLEQIAWLEDGSPDEATLRRLAGPIAGTELDLAAELRRFEALLARPAVLSALSRSGYANLAALGFSSTIAQELTASLADGAIRLELNRERSFAVRRNDAIVQGAIDRLLLFLRGDKLLAADILDFKTDAVTDSAAVNEPRRNLSAAA